MNNVNILASGNLIKSIQVREKYTLCNKKKDYRAQLIVELISQNMYWMFFFIFIFNKVSQAKPLKMQSELMVEEMMNAEEFEYAPKGLPMLLHQVIFLVH